MRPRSRHRGPVKLRVAYEVACTEAEGPHRRHALWVAGCSLRCPGCCNAELFDTLAGEARSVDDLVGRVGAAARELELEGITILGGEPLEQPAGVTALASGVRALGLGVIVFTGYTLAEARARPGFSALWPQLDTLVDGRFDLASPEPASPPGRRFLGSTNQRLRHRTPRYADPRLWQGPREAELQIAPDGRVSVHGFPNVVAPLRRRLVQLGE